MDPKATDVNAEEGLVPAGHEHATPPTGVDALRYSVVVDKQGRVMLWVLHLLADSIHIPAIHPPPFCARHSRLLFANGRGLPDRGAAGDWSSCPTWWEHLGLCMFMFFVVVIS